MNQFEFSRKIPVEYRPEVLVLGAGPAGICAALAAARGGADTMLVERYGCAGGMATMGLVAPFMTSYDSGGRVRLIRGLFSEIVERMVALGGAIDPSGVPAGSAFTSYIEKGHIHVTPFDAECLKLVADRMLAEAGVRLLYHSSFVAAEAEGGVVKRVIIMKKEGLSAIEPGYVIDCTGDGDVAASAGAAFTLGSGVEASSDKKPKMQPATMFFRIGNVDTSALEADIIANKDNFFRRNGINYRSLHWRVSEAREAGDWTLERVSVGIFRGVREDEWSVNTSRIMEVDGTDSESLTRAEIIGRRQCDEIFRFLVKYVPGCENARLLGTAPSIGIRETRHIIGCKTLTLDSLLGGAIPEDTVLLAANSVDVHGKFGPMSNEYITLAPGEAYGLSYRCLIPRGFDNLLVAGRCVSADSDAAGAIRVMPPCMAMGQAAGAAAAIAAREDCATHEVRYEVLRSALLSGGVYLGEE